MTQLVWRRTATEEVYGLNLADIRFLFFLIDIFKTYFLFSIVRYFGHMGYGGSAMIIIV